MSVAGGLCEAHLVTAVPLVEPFPGNPELTTASWLTQPEEPLRRQPTPKVDTKKLGAELAHPIRGLSVYFFM